MMTPDWPDGSSRLGLAFPVARARHFTSEKDQSTFNILVTPIEVLRAALFRLWRGSGPTMEVTKDLSWAWRANAWIDGGAYANPKVGPKHGTTDERL